MNNFTPLKSYSKTLEINYIPPIQTSITQLDYNNLTHNWEVFENLILDLVRDIEGDNLDIDLYKNKGAKQEGIDIYKFDENHDFEKVYQCKRYVKFSKSSLDKAVKAFEEGAFANIVNVFVIAISVDVSYLVHEIQAYKKRFKELGVRFEVWDPSTLNKFLVNRPKIVHRFFDGNRFPAQYVKLFCGEEHLEGLEYKGIEKYSYDFNSQYIERLCDKTIDPEEINQGFSWPINITFKEYIEGNSQPLRILLRSSPGVGKTTELEYIANLLSKGKLCPEKYPFRYYLKNYSSGRIEERLSETYPNWKYIRNRLFLFLDGYDEIPETSQRTFNNAIREFVDLNPGVSVVISVRHNSTPEGLDCFEKIELLRLEEYQIREYLRSKLNNNFDIGISLFLSKCRELKIQEILKNPFELACLVDVFNEGGELPNNKYDLLLKVREERLSNEKVKERFTSPIVRETHNILLRKLSIVLMLLDRQGINQTNLLELSLCGEELEIIRNSPFIHYSEEDISFIHNNFKEFYLADALKTLNVEQIKTIICFKEGEILKPKWKNGLSFFFASHENEEIKTSLSSFIIEKDPMYIVGIEKERVPFFTRLNFFKEVFYNLKTYFAKPISLEELFDFVELNDRPDVLQFILQEIQENNNVFNGLYVLKSLSNPFHFDGQIKTVLKQVLENLEYEPRSHKYAIEILQELGFLDEVFLKDIFEKQPSFTNVDVRAAFLRCLHTKELMPNYIDFAFTTIRQIESQSKREGYYSYWYIFDGLKQLSEISHIEQFLSETKKLFADNHLKWLNGQKDFIENFFASLRRYGKNKSVRDKIIETITIEKNYSLKDFWLLPCFRYLEETGYAEYTFWKLWKEYEYKVWWLGQGLQLLVSRTTIIKMVDRLNSSIDKEEEAFRFIQILGTDQEKIFVDKVNSLDTLGLNFQLRKPYIDNYENDTKEETILLQDKTSFLKSLKMVYFDKRKVLTAAQLDDRSFYELADRRNISWGLLKERSDRNNGKIRFEEILEHFKSKENWESFVLYELGKVLIHRKELLNEEQIKYIESLVLDLLPLDFRNARGMNEDGGNWYNINVNNFCIYYIHLRPKIEKKILLQMLSFDDSGINDYSMSNGEKNLIEVIREELDDDQIFAKQILQNLKQGLDYPNTIGTHFRLCKELKIYKSIETLADYLKKEKLGLWNMEKGIEIYLELGGSISLFQNVPWIFDSEKSWHWLVIGKFYDKNDYREQIISKLEELSSYGEDDKHLSTARDLLMKSTRLSGLKLLEITIQKSRTDLFRGNDDLENLLAHYPSIESKFIFKAMYKKGSKNSGVFNDMMDFFINSAVKTALLQPSFYDMVLSLFSENNQEYHIQRYEENFKKEYWLKKVEFKSITEVNNYLEENLII